MSSTAPQYLSENQLLSLYEYLDITLAIHPCNHGMENTKAYLISEGLDLHLSVKAIMNQGHLCDCEVLEAYREHKRIVELIEQAVPSCA